MTELEQLIVVSHVRSAKFRENASCVRPDIVLRSKEITSVMLCAFVYLLIEFSKKILVKSCGCDAFLILTLQIIDGQYVVQEAILTKRIGRESNVRVEIMC